MPSKKDLDALLNAPAPLPEIRRGRGVRLSTEGAISADMQDSKPASGATPAKVDDGERKPHGFAVRVGLVKRMRRVAAQKDRKMYEVMEEAMEDFLARNEISHGNV